jgi:hypothetical protein
MLGLTRARGHCESVASVTFKIFLLFFNWVKLRVRSQIHPSYSIMYVLTAAMDTGRYEEHGFWNEDKQQRTP